LRAITVRMVLGHTSGLPNIANGPLAFEAEPGSQWTYSGEGYILLQRAVEAVTGQPLDGVMAALVFRPLKMNSSSYVADPRTKAAMLAPVGGDGAQVSSIDFPVSVSAFSLHTTIEDYGKFLAGVLSDPKLLDAIVTSPVAVDASLHLEWGLGWGLERTGGNLNIWHWGNNPGYRAFVIASVKSGDGMVLLTNSESGLALARPLTERVLPGRHDVFHFYMLREGVAHFACKTIGTCW
jgi:CubicO group peptidase (beta-lactamase class C family)